MLEHVATLPWRTLGQAHHLIGLVLFVCFRASPELAKQDPPSPSHHPRRPSANMH